MQADPHEPGWGDLDLSLPAGSYMITAKATLQNSNPVNDFDMECALIDANSWGSTGYGTVWDTFSSNLAPDTGARTGYGTGVLGTAQSFNATTTVRVLCYLGSNTGGGWIQAVKLDALN
jgi:hypothetical protein